MFNNPFPYQNFSYPTPGLNNPGIRRGLFSSISMGIKSVNWSNLLNNTQKTLNVINQAIPVYYQVKPIYNNAKTMLRMVSALKDDKKESTMNKSIKQENNEQKNTNQEGPVFFL